MRSTFPLAFWLLLLLTTWYKAASHPADVSFQAQESETGLELYGFTRDKRSTYIRNADAKAMTFKKLRQDREVLETNYNAIEKILPAPLAINLLSQILLIAAVATDFSVICPTEGCKHLNYPGSFKASLLQLSQSSYDAFNAAHVNMDVINRNMKTIPSEVRYALETLLTGSEYEIKEVLPDQLDELKRIARVSRDHANDTVAAFTVVKNILEELIAGGKAKELDSKDQVQSLDIQIDANRRRQDNWEKRKQELTKLKAEAKKELEEAEKKYEEAIDNIPDGWDMMGMMVVESMANTFVSIVNILGLKFSKMAGEGGQDQQTQQKMTESLRFPSCNLLLPPKGAEVTITDAKQLGVNFMDAVNNMQMTVSILSNNVENIFDMPSKDKLSLKPDIGKVTQDVKKVLSPNKEQIENSGANTVPMGVKGPAVAFYKKIFLFLDEVTKKSESRNASPEEVKKLFEEAEELQEAANCFHSWLIKLLDLPPVSPRKPFNEKPKNHDNSITQKHAESAKYKVENLKAKWEKEQEKFTRNSEQLLAINSNLTEAIVTLAKFEASKATLQEILKVLEEALEKLSQLQKHWMEIREFFQLINNIISVNIGETVVRYAGGIKNGIHVGSLRKKSHFLNKIFENIMEINTHSFLVHRMSNTYLDVSDKYIMPPVRKLGEMIHADVNKSKKLRGQIGAETQVASRKMRTILMAQKDAFWKAMTDRRKEIDEIYNPIIEKISKKRQREIENVVQGTSAAVPTKFPIQDLDLEWGG